MNFFYEKMKKQIERERLQDLCLLEDTSMFRKADLGEESLRFANGLIFEYTENNCFPRARFPRPISVLISGADKTSMVRYIAHRFDFPIIKMEANLLRTPDALSIFQVAKTYSCVLCLDHADFLAGPKRAYLRSFLRSEMDRMPSRVLFVAMVDAIATETANIFDYCLDLSSKL